MCTFSAYFAFDKATKSTTKNIKHEMGETLSSIENQPHACFDSNPSPREIYNLNVIVIIKCRQADNSFTSRAVFLMCMLILFSVSRHGSGHNTSKAVKG